MDNLVRILQRQIRHEVDVNSLPPSLLQYIASLERIAGIGSITEPQTEIVEQELDLRDAFMQHASCPQQVAGPIATRIIRALTRLNMPASLETLSQVNPLELAVQRNMGSKSMATAAEVLAAEGLLTPAWIQFIVRNRLYIEGSETTPRRNPYGFFTCDYDIL